MMITTNPPHRQDNPTISPAVRGDMRLRWVILVMLFVTTFLNYFDRQTISVLKPVIKAEFGLSDYGYAQIITAFMVTYMIAYMVCGRLVDWIGSRLSLAIFVGVWSLANMCVGFSHTLAQLTVCQVMMGAAEPGNYPAALRVATTWFPSKLRGFACSVYQAGSATAAVLAMPVIAMMASLWGWRTVFILPGCIGLLWVVAWWWMYRSPSREYAKQNIQEESPRIPWIQLMRNRNVWGIILARLISDQVWYFCLFWMPGYIQEKLHLTLIQAGLIGWMPFLCADIGGIASGFISDRLIAAGREPDRARKQVLTGMACLAPFAIMIPFVNSIPMAIALFCVIAVVSQVWLFSITTLVSDIFPRTSVASVLGISGSFGALGGMLSSQVIGLSVGTFGYTPIFMVLGCLHLCATVAIRMLVRAPGTSLPAAPAAAR